MTRLRTFVAVMLDAPVRSALGAWMSEARPALPGFRWTEPENLHLTLRFLGDTDPAALPRLGEALAAVAAGFPGFPLTFRGAGAFPDARAPRVIWAGAEAGPVLPALQRRLEERVRALGWAPETKPFRPHVTLARARDPRTAGGAHPAAPRDPRTAGGAHPAAPRDPRTAGGAHPAAPRDDVAALARVRSRVWGTVAVREVLLMQSTLTPAGAVHTPLQRFPLGVGR